MDKSYLKIHKIIITLFLALSFVSVSSAQCPTGQVAGASSNINIYATAVIFNNGVGGANNAVGNNNGTSASLNSNADQLVLQMGQAINSGDSVTVNGQNGDDVDVWVSSSWGGSIGATIWTQVGSNAQLDFTFNSPIDWEYIRIERGDGTGTEDISFIDASTTFTTCLDDTDNDGVANVDDLDDDNDGILDTDEGCTQLPASPFTLNSSLSVLGDVDTPGRLVYEDTNGNQVILTAAGGDGNNNTLGVGPNEGTIVNNTTTGQMFFEVGGGDVDDQPKLHIQAISASGTPFDITSISFGNIGNMDNSGARDIIAANVLGTWDNLGSAGNVLAVAQMTPTGATPVSGVTQTTLNSFELNNFISQGAISQAIFNNDDNSIQFGYNARFSPTNPTSSFLLIVDDAEASVSVRNIVTEITAISMTISGTICPDTDGDGITDNLDLDSDGDGCSDAVEAGTTTDQSTNYQFPSNDVNNTTGVPNTASTSNNTGNFQNAAVTTCSCPFASGLDSDNDGVDDTCDDDHDNDGILNSVENPCSLSQTTNWNSSGTTATGSAGGTNVAFAVTNDSNTSITYSPNGAFNTTNFWSNSSLAGDNSLEYIYTWDTTTDANTSPASDDAGTATFTITFSQKVYNPIIHIDRLGGSGQEDSAGPNYISNSSEFTLTTPGIAFKKLSGNNQFIVNGNKFFRAPNINLGTTDPGSESGSDYTRTAAGSVQVIGSVTSLTFSVTGIGVEGVGFDGVEMIFEACPAIDTDNDGTPDYLDLDSDNDGCSDAVEAGTTTSQTPNYQFPSNDVNATTGVPNGAAAANNSGDFQNAAVTSCDCPFPSGIDTDGDGVDDTCDLDDDNDGILDTDENASCGITNSILLSQDFGNAANATPSSSVTLASLNPGITTAYGYDALSNPYAGNDLDDDFYSVFNNIPESAIWAATGSAVWQDIGDHTDGGSLATTGRMLMVNAGNTLDAIYQQNLTGVGTGALIDVSFWILNLDVDKPSNAGRGLPNVQIELWQNGAILGTAINTGDVQRETKGDTNAWKKFETTTPIVALDNSNITFIIRNNVSNTNGNDLAIDDILVTQACDTDGDGTPNYQDTDSDNDGCPDALEANATLNYSDLNADGSIDTSVNTTGANIGVPGTPATDAGTSADASQQADECDPCNNTSELFADNDLDGIGDQCDLDDDNDGILDTVECPLTEGTFTGGQTGTISDGTNTANYALVQNSFVGYNGAAVYTASANGIEVQGNTVDAGNDSLNYTLNLSNVSAGVIPVIRFTQRKGSNAGNGEASDITLSWPGSGLGGYVDEATPSASMYALGAPSGFDLNNRQIEGLGTEGVITSGSKIRIYQIFNSASEWYVQFPAGETSVTIDKTVLNSGISSSEGIDYRYPQLGFSGNSGESFNEWISFQVFFMPDTDGDGIADCMDLDSDGDGCPDSVEAGVPTTNLVAGDLVNVAGTTTGVANAKFDGSNVGANGLDNSIENIDDETATTTYTSTYSDALDENISTACNADLSLTKTVNKAIVKINDTIIYTLTVTNSGAADATGVQVTDVLPAGLTYVSHTSGQSFTDSGDADSLRDLWTIGNLNANQSITLQITVTVNSAGTITNTAEITQSNQTDSDSTPASGN
ncbi:hypothetical protein LPB136_02030 [Tenacibaculum todarodis]|uniref:DUF11 domain-containing protein n=1 Tax=Tenacibaculum todarodis TaxID=1850252 RepID=A0A1L3JGF6_9FLAO|nr:DUF11 domain-containing protein [Tenacibaculum todarodis]APG64218.1 hypothetical protein LPB136_02030 [Tenacibaculum todarodis]